MNWKKKREGLRGDKSSSKGRLYKVQGKKNKRETLRGKKS